MSYLSRRAERPEPISDPITIDTETTPAPALQAALRELGRERAKRRALEQQVDTQARRLREEKNLIGFLSIELNQAHMRERELQDRLAQAERIRFSTNEKAEILAAVEMLVLETRDRN